MTTTICGEESIKRHLSLLHSYFTRHTLSVRHLVCVFTSSVMWLCRASDRRGAGVHCNVARLQGTFPEPLQPAANSVVCTSAGDSSLLRAVFNETPHVEHPISFPPSRCRTAISRCQQCLTQAHCRHRRGMYAKRE